VHVYPYISVQPNDGIGLAMVWPVTQGILCFVLFRIRRNLFNWTDPRPEPSCGAKGKERTKTTLLN